VVTGITFRNRLASTKNRVDMGHESSVEVATTFLKRFSDGDFDKADDLIHPEGADGGCW
jgi:hypothetical protein